MTSEKVTIRQESTADAQAIRDLLQGSFPGGKEAELVEKLRFNQRLSISLVAELGGTIVGHVAFSPVTVENRNPGLGLAPVAVHPAQRCRGIAADLIRTGLQLCQDSAIPYAVVLGDPAYYSRFGFKPAADWNLSDEYGGGPAFQALEILPGGIPRPGGLVRYTIDFAIFLE